MDFQDFIISPSMPSFDKWQLGEHLVKDVDKASVALLFVSDYRGAGFSGESLDFTPLRQELYKLSSGDFSISVCDFGDLISGKSQEDTHYVLQEFLSFCHYRKIIPVVIGGSSDLSFSLYSALDFQYKDLSYCQVSSSIALENHGEVLNERGFLSKIFSSKNFSVKNYHHIGYQRHLNEYKAVDLINEVNFDAIKLSKLMGDPGYIEPFVRHADLFTLDCNAVESTARAFSTAPQVNGLNRREILRVMKEVGMGTKLKSVGIFNPNIEQGGKLNNQLLAQMIWYLLEGIDIMHSHPKTRNYETFIVMNGENSYTFKRDVFAGLWYFGENIDVNECLPCSEQDYIEAKAGSLNKRLARWLNM